jgi:hypothetical protein
MSRRIMLSFDHASCSDGTVDIYLPLPDPIQESAEAMADRHRPACPICKQPARYVGWRFETAEEFAS